jgi:putative nucleotidyltransferase with HDIG domain
VYTPPQTGPLAGHLRRVSALAREIAARLRLKPTDIDALAEAALLHHYPAEVLEAEPLNRLLADLRLGAPHGAASAFPPRRVRDVLERFHAGRSANAAHVLAQIVQVADFFDERLEFFSFEPMNFEQIIDELDWMAKDGFLDPAVVAALAGLPQVRMHELLEQVNRLPVFPAVLLRTLEITADEDSSFSRLECIVGSDQVLAGHLLRMANSSLHSSLQPIASILQAISYVGLDTCRKVMMARVFQPLFSSTPMRDLWRHSLAMARLTERLAQLCGRFDPQEAFLAGLVHDVGRLALQKLRREYVMDYQRLIEGGCEPVFAEMLLCGFEHSAIGAEILRSWTFPEHLIEAVLRHHRPELGDSLLASALYLAENLSGAREDIASPARMDLAHARLGLASEIPEGEGPPDPGWLDFLVSAA